MAKAWFRRGEAQLALNDCESARADFDKCLQLEPDNKVRQHRGGEREQNRTFMILLQAAKNKISICQYRLKAQKEKEKKTFANMFDKFAEIDKKKEDMERKRNARPDTMQSIDEWESQ